MRRTSQTRAPNVHSFHRGSLALDFAGTVGWRASGDPQERLPDAAALERWFHDAGLLAATVRPHPAHVRSADLQFAVALREAIFSAGNALIDASAPHGRDLAAINEAAAGHALAVPMLADDLTQRWKTSQPVRFALARIAFDAITIFSCERSRLTRCALDACGALLLSRARNEPRRWCSMQTCGNRAKVAAFRARNPASR
ncbi:MAG: ABATE domain-containing protein [Candidatus Velthaea sp.]